MLFRLTIALAALATVLPASPINFDDILFAPNSFVTNQYASSGVTFEKTETNGFRLKTQTDTPLAILPSTPQFVSIMGTATLSFWAGSTAGVTNFFSFSNVGQAAGLSILDGILATAYDVNGNTLGQITVNAAAQGTALANQTWSFSIGGIHSVTFSHISAPGGPAMAAFDDVNFNEVAGVPEPGTFALGIAGLALAFGLRKFRKA